LEEQALIFHIVAHTEWNDAIRRGLYRPSSLRTEGIIHCSTLEQIVDTADSFYRGRDALVILCVEKRCSPLRSATNGRHQRESNAWKIHSRTSAGH
jgi:uncharacterized protein (DUF952 family)